MTWRVDDGDCREVMARMDAESVTAIVSDPPYGLSDGSGKRGFMGHEWDAKVPGVEFWTAAYRVLKPGGMLLAFGGTRTWHRLACAIEDAGFEMRDSLMWLYGQGFPKSADISKLMDKADRLERAVIGQRRYFARDGYIRNDSCRDGTVAQVAGENAWGSNITAPASPESALWHGYGSALKPAHEDIILAVKPLDAVGVCSQLAQKIGAAICQLSRIVKDAESRLPSRLHTLTVADSAIWNAVRECNTPGDLFARMDTLRSGLETPLSLSTALSWLDTLGAILKHESTSTTKTESSLTTELRILNYSPLQITPDTIIEAAICQLGIGSSASIVADIFNAARSRLLGTQGYFANALATLQEGEPGLRPNWEPIILAMKPNAGTFAQNARAHGVAGLNIDGCRIGVEKNWPSSRNYRPGNISPASGVFSDGGGIYQKTESDGLGRWPANVILDEQAVALLDEMTKDIPLGGGSYSQKPISVKALTDGSSFKTPARTFIPPGDMSVERSRFFYCGKASRSEREAGLESKNGERACTHSTVKPLDLMRWLCRLVKMPKGTVILDPFCGSGTTGCAAVLENCDFIGIELNPEYARIARARIAHWEKTGAPPETPKRNPAEMPGTPLFGEL